MLNLFIVQLIIVISTIINNIRIMNNNLMDSVLKVSTNGCHIINGYEEYLLVTD